MTPAERLHAVFVGCETRLPNRGEEDFAADGEALDNLAIFANTTMTGLQEALVAKGLTENEAAETSAHKTVLLVFLRGMEYGRLLEVETVSELNEILNGIED